MNSFMNNLTNTSNYKFTENGAVAHKTTTSAVLDLFAFGGAYRTRSEQDCIFLFKNAFEENKTLALKCLFYLRDIRGGQGERRFFRICFNWLAKNYSEVAKANLVNLSEYGRWDDVIYTCVGTPIETAALNVIKHQLALDVTCKTPSLLAKWLPSENASAKETKKMGAIVRAYLHMSHKEYRQVLSALRTKINIVEKLMSQNRWDEIEFDKLPSKAGLVYKNAFARRDILAKKYEAFAKDKTTKVNAAALYPYEIVAKAIAADRWGHKASETDRAMIEKYWENQIDVLNGEDLSMLCVCDTSGSMCGSDAMAPINVAIGLSIYAAERAGGAFKNHYISFSSRPQLIKIEGVDFVDKVQRIYRTNLCDNTDLVATFRMLKQIALKSKKEDIPKTIVVISDMEIDHATGGYWRNDKNWTKDNIGTEMENLRREWAAAGLTLPRLVYWNVQARQNTILDLGPNVSYVSGASPSIFKQVVTGKTGWDLMLEVLNFERYDAVVVK